MPEGHRAQVFGLPVPALGRGLEAESRERGRFAIQQRGKAQIGARHAVGA